MNSPRTTLYRDKHNAKLLGVCSGIADYTGVSVGWVRLCAIVLAITVTVPTVPAYLIAGFVLSKKPPHLYVDQDEQQRHSDAVQRTAPTHHEREGQAEQDHHQRREGLGQLPVEGHP